MTAIDLRGRWLSEWVESEDKVVQGFMELRHTDKDQVEGEDRAEGAAYCLKGTIKGNNVAGTWHGEENVKDYSGTFDLTIEDGGGRLKGTYTTDGGPSRLRYRATRMPDSVH